MNKLVLALALVGVAAVAIAATNPVSHSYEKIQGDLLTAVAMDASQADRTFSVAEKYIQGMGLLVLHIVHVNDSATVIDMNCEASDDAGTTWHAVQVCDVSSGACTSSDASWEKAVAASDNWVWRVDILGYRRVRCEIDSTGGVTDDVVTVTGHTSAL